MIKRLTSGVLLFTIALLALGGGLGFAPYLYVHVSPATANIVGVGGLLLASVGITFGILVLAVGHD